MTTKHFSEFTAPFGDGDHVFVLTHQLASQWESENDRSLMATFTAMTRSHRPEVYMHLCRELVRLAMIGGGMKPVDALAKVRAYCDSRPGDEWFLISLTIAESFLFGTPEWRAANGKSDAPVGMEPQ